MYEEITAVQYERLRNVMPVVNIIMVDGIEVENGFALAEEVCSNRSGIVFYIAYRIGDRHYWGMANIRLRNHHYVTRFSFLRKQAGYRARWVPDNDCLKG